MTHGGRRDGAGRKSGSRNRPKFQLEAAPEAPPAKLTPAQLHKLMARKVSLCVADGMPPEKIAVVMGLALDRLQALYPRELAHGRELVRIEELERLDQQAAEGKVAASKVIFETAGSAGAGGASSKRSAQAPRPASLNERALKLISGGKSET